MDIFIDPDSTVGLAKQIYEAVRDGILEGRLNPGDRLPPSRELAETLDVSRHTVTTAYGHLAAEGFLDGRRGGGTVVSDLFALTAPDPQSEWVLDFPRPESVPEVAFDLRPGTPDPRLFPSSEWKRHARWAVDDSEFRYVDRPLEPLFRLDRSGQVAYVASFSKTLSPAIRLGYVVVPRDVLVEVLDLRAQVDWAPSLIDQLTLRGYIASGEFERHLRRTRRIYQERHALVTEFLRRTAARDHLQPSASNAGLHISARLSRRHNESTLLTALGKRGVAIEGLTTYASGSTPTPGLVVSFGQTDSNELADALATVSDVLENA